MDKMRLALGLTLWFIGVLGLAALFDGVPWCWLPLIGAAYGFAWIKFFEMRSP